VSLRRASVGPRRVAVALALRLAVGAAVGAGTAETAAAAAASTAAPAAGPGQPCRLDGLPQSARCGVVKRPLDPAQPQSVLIDVHYAVVPALARHKAGDAVFFFAGGPGQSAIDLAGPLAARYGRLNQQRDLVFIDQRGTGRSAPLKCADDDERAALLPLAERADEAQRLPRLHACRQALQALPYGDLRFFTTELASGDVDAVRQALGVPRLNAIGASYGTRAVLDYQRQFPAHVRRAVLDGVAPPDMRLADTAARDNQAAFEALLAACAAEPACARRHPQLRAQWAALLAGLPRPVQLPHPVNGRIETITLQRDTLLALVRAPLYAPILASALPMAIDEATAGRWAPLAALAQAMGGSGAAGMFTGMHFSVVCAEDLGPGAPPNPAAGAAGAAATAVPATTAATAGTTAGTTAAITAAITTPGNDFGDSFARLYRAVCADWPRGAVSPAFYTMVTATAPVWLMSGGLDPVTPPRHAERVARALGPKARHIVVNNAGHGVAALGCVRDAVMRFITTVDDAEALAGDAGCAAKVPRPPAFVPPGARALPAAAGASR